MPRKLTQARVIDILVTFREHYYHDRVSVAINARFSDTGQFSGVWRDTYQLPLDLVAAQDIMAVIRHYSADLVEAQLGPIVPQGVVSEPGAAPDDRVP
jgi:hypothetical protein